MTDHAADIAVAVEGPEAPGPVVLVCEHASNAFPPRWGDLGLDAGARAAHVAWDPGALGLARALARRLNAVLVRACSSRLIYDLNRPPQAPGAMPARSERYDIPGNAAITPAQRWDRTQALYLPFHAALRVQIAQRLALHAPAGQGEAAQGATGPALITVHSFTPVFHGQPRAVEFGVIHDADPRLARAIVAQAQARTDLVTRLNEPYSAADGVAHTLALQATPMGLPAAMLEIRNDLIADAPAQEAMAARLAPVLAAALADLAPQEAA